MKKLIAILIVLAGFGAYAQHDHSAHAKQSQAGPSFKDEKIGAAYARYIDLKDALVKSNAENAKKAATELENALQATPNGKKASQTAGKIANATNIDGQRMLFVVLSDEMTVLIKANKLSSGAIYLEYCPMANNNEGAYWLSNEKEIRNPYFGDMMLKCGSVKETVQ
jgi:hypothetical protein